MLFGKELGGIYKWGWVPFCAACVSACSSTSVALFPESWAAVDGGSDARCEISGDYENVGEVARYGVSRASNKAFLDHLLLAGRGGPIADRMTEYVSLRVSGDKLFATLHSRNTWEKEERLSFDIAACQDDGYKLRFSSVTQSEYSAVDHRTIVLSLTRSTDGSLIGKANIEFVSKGELFPSRSAEVVWYRFQRD